MFLKNLKNKLTSMHSSVFQSCSLIFEDCRAIATSQKSKWLHWLDNLKKTVVKLIILETNKIYYGKKVMKNRPSPRFFFPARSFSFGMNASHEWACCAERDEPKPSEIDF